MVLTPCPRGCQCGRCRRSREMFAAVMLERAVTQAALVRAINHWRWCWDCGTPKQDCELSVREKGTQCCPDCKHRDAVTARIAFLAEAEEAASG